MKRFFAVCSFIGLTMATVPPAMADTIRINFNTLPGTDNILGTSDDVAIGDLPFRVTSDYSFLQGGVGVIFDSLCCTAPEGIGLAAITSVEGVNQLVQARPDVGPAAFSFGSVGIRLVSSVDGVTPVGVVNTEITLSAGATGSVAFYNLNGDLRASFAIPSDGSTKRSYSDTARLSRVVFTGTGGITQFGFDTLEPLPAPPEAAAPEATAHVMMISGTLLLISSGRLRKRKPPVVPKPEPVLKTAA